MIYSLRHFFADKLTVIFFLYFYLLLITKYFKFSLSLLHKLKKIPTHLFFVSKYKIPHFKLS